MTVSNPLATHDVAHFVCHGKADYYEPFNSYLFLAGGEHFTLLKLSRAGQFRLVVLSACETGLGNVALPDDVLSVPAALMEAGSAGVVASLWPVDDGSSMLVMARFYGLWRRERLSPPAALRQAQLWLRTSTTSERREVLEGLVKGEARRSTLIPENVDVHHWAPFVFYGA